MTDSSRDDYSSADHEQHDLLEGQILIAMPGMNDKQFERSVVLICTHSAENGAIGLVINKTADNITFSELLDQIGIEKDDPKDEIRIHFGGPVDRERGFVLHSTDYLVENTIEIEGLAGLTGTVDILKAIADGNGPKRCLLALGYAGWAPGQLEAELRANGWLHCPPDEDLLFGEDLKSKWTSALSKLGIDLSRFSGTAGNA